MFFFFFLHELWLNRHFFFQPIWFIISGDRFTWDMINCCLVFTWMDRHALQRKGAMCGKVMNMFWFIFIFLSLSGQLPKDIYRPLSAVVVALVSLLIWWEFVFKTQQRSSLDKKLLLLSKGQKHASLQHVQQGSKDVHLSLNCPYSDWGFSFGALLLCLGF